MGKHEAEYLKILVQVVGHYQSDLVFTVLLMAYMHFGNFTESQIAEELQVSRPTVNRWLRGRNLPALNLREGIYNWLSDKINKL